MTINLTALQKQRRDTAANWTGANPTLLAGEIGIESDTNKIKIGDGSTAWTSLGYTTWSQISAYPIINADVAAAAAISYSKLATLTSGNIVLGSSANVATSTAVTGDVTISNTGVTAIATGVIVNADINASAAIADTKLGTISTALKVSNSATTATDANTPSAIVARDASGNFTAGTITAALTGIASGNLVAGGALGTPASGTLTSCTGLPISTGVSGLGTGAATFLATPSSANLAALLTDETGSGAAVFATSPTFVTPALGTPSSGNLTNCTFPTLNQNTTGNAATVTTNANLTGDVTSVGNATVIAAGVIVDADVNASAAIAGTKVAPNFGAQTVITTGSGLIGTATSLTTLYSGAGKFQVASNDATTIQGYAFSSAGVDYSATLELSRARNTQASPTIVANGDYIGQINFAGYNTNFQRGATIYALVDGEPGTAGDTTDMPGKLVFATSSNGSATPTTRMSIDSAGLVTLAGALDVPLGTAALPSISFTGDTNTGIFSPGADQVAVATNGTQRLTVDTAATTSTLPVVHPLGAVGTPSLTFTGDLNTGIFSPGADQVAISTNGTSRLSIDASGNIAVDTNTLYVDAVNNKVGVGTASPSGLIDAQQSSSGANVAFRFRNTANTAGSTTTIDLSEDGAGRSVWRYSPNTGDTFFGSVDAGAYNLRFYTNANERLRITSTGALNFVGAGTAGSTQAVSFNGSAPVNSMVLTSGGLLGIGSSAPQAELNVAKTGGTATVYIESDAGNNATTSILRFGGASGRSASIQGFRGASSNVHSLDFYTYNSADAFGMRLTPTGLGIGSTAPTELLSVNGNLWLGNGGGSGGSEMLRIWNDSGVERIHASNNPSALAFGMGGSSSAFEAFRIDSSRRLLVGTSSAYEDYYGTSNNWRGIFQVARNANDAVAQFSNWNSTASASNGGTQLYLSACKSGAIGTHTGGALANGDSIGSIIFNASDGSNFRTAAWIQAAIDGTPGTADVPGRLVFSTTADGASSPTERMRITNNGYLKASNTASYAAGSYHVFDNDTTNTNVMRISNRGASYSGDAMLQMSFLNTTPNTTAAWFLYCSDATNQKASILTTGTYESRTSTYGGVSDLKLKQDIEDAGSQWSDIKSLQVRKYRFKDEPEGDLQIGLVAQEAEQVSPGLVYETPDRDSDGNDLGTVTKGLKYSVLYMKAVKALQEAMERIEQLEAKVAALEAA